MSDPSPDPKAGSPSLVHELAGRIKALKMEHSIEAAPHGTAPRRVVTAEVPVTARIRRRAESEVVAEPESTPAAEMPPAEAATPPPVEQPSAKPTVIELPDWPQSGYRQHVARTRRENGRQLNLF